MKEIAICLGYFVMIISPFLISVALYSFFDKIDTYESRTDYAHDRLDEVLEEVSQIQAEVKTISSRVDKLEDPKDASN